MSTISVYILSKFKTSHSVGIAETLNNNNIATYLVEENALIPKSYYGLNRIKKSPTAWESLFYLLDKESDIHVNNYYWFIEDDVYSKSNETFIELINFYKYDDYDLITGDLFSRADMPDWYWWKDKQINKYRLMHRSFNPICRISKNLLNIIQQFRLLNNTFCFHEALFASLALSNNLKTLDYNKINDHPLIGQVRYRPIFNIKDIIDTKIYHPVKEIL